MYHSTTVVGRMGQDPDTRYMPSGDAVCNFSVAANEKFKHRDGSPGEHTQWYNCRAYGKLAEIIAEYRHKGDLVFCVGRMHTDKWKTQDGQDRERTYLNVDTVRGFSQGNSAAPQEKKHAASHKAQTPPPQQPDFNDDIPF